MIQKASVAKSGQAELRRARASAKPLIGRRAGICGGDACVLGTRIPVWGLESARRKGFSDTQIMRMYPGLKKKHLKAAWDYVKLHEAEIEREILENEA